MMDDTETQQAVGEARTRLADWRAEIIASIVLVGYTLVRTLAVAEGISPRDHAVSWRVFLVVEIGTTLPYVYGMGVLARSAAGRLGHRDPSRVVAAALAGGSLLAPYAYLAVQGRGMPMTVWALTAMVASLCLVAPARRFLALRHRLHPRRQRGLHTPRPTPLSSRSTTS